MARIDVLLRGVRDRSASDLRLTAGSPPVLVIGHQPTLGQAAALALTGRVEDWTVQKGAIWWLTARDGNEAMVRAVIAPDLL